VADDDARPIHLSPIVLWGIQTTRPSLSQCWVRVAVVDDHVLFIGTRFSNLYTEVDMPAYEPVYLKESTYHTRLFRGTSTNYMKK
jgi:hypothetical protein